jgi:hypothetical protein
MSRFVSFLFHGFALAVIANALHYHHFEVSPKQAVLRGFEFGGPFIYITIIANVSLIQFSRSLIQNK